MWQDIIIIIIAIAVAGIVGRWLYQQFTKPKDGAGGCSGCSGCASAKSCPR